MKSSVYIRPNKPKMIDIKRRREAGRLALPAEVEPLAVDSFTECHVTPDGPAARMVDYLGLDHKDLNKVKILEPQAGTGALVRALLAYGLPAQNITAIERHYNLCEAISKRFEAEALSPLQSCFLDYADDNKDLNFDYIVMNPPFKNVKKHMNAALSFLKSGALVALVPVTYQHPEAVELEMLDNSTFLNAKVHTKIIRIER